MSHSRKILNRVFLPSFLIGCIGIFLCGTGFFIAEGRASAGKVKSYVSREFGIRFDYPDHLSQGRFKEQEIPQSLIDDGFKIPFVDSIVLVEPDQLGNFSVDAVPVGEVPALWLDVSTAKQATFMQRFLKKEYEKILGKWVVYHLPGYPGPYGDQAHYYLLPLAEGRILEIAAHKYYFRDPSYRYPANSPQTNYDKIIESIIKSLKISGE